MLSLFEYIDFMVEETKWKLKPKALIRNEDIFSQLIPNPTIPTTTKQYYSHQISTYNA